MSFYVREYYMSGCNRFQTCFAVSTLLASVKRAGHSSFIKRMAKLLRHLPTCFTVQKVSNDFLWPEQQFTLVTDMKELLRAFTFLLPDIFLKSAVQRISIIEKKRLTFFKSACTQHSFLQYVFMIIFFFFIKDPFSAILAV